MHGTFKWVSVANMSLRNDKSPRGLAPDAHLADGVAHLVLVRHCNRLRFLQLLLRLARGGDHLALPMVERIPVTAVRMSLAGASRIHTSWNVDGELHESSDVRIQVMYYVAWMHHIAQCYACRLPFGRSRCLRGALKVFDDEPAVSLLIECVFRQCINLNAKMIQCIMSF